MRKTGMRLWENYMWIDNLQQIIRFSQGSNKKGKTITDTILKCIISCNLPG